MIKWNLERLRCLLRFGRKQSGPWNEDSLYGELPDEEDAQLICAVPDLLEALQDVLREGVYNDVGDFVLRHKHWDGKGDPPDTNNIPTIDKIYDAVAKAQGRRT